MNKRIVQGIFLGTLVIAFASVVYISDLHTIFGSPKYEPRDPKGWMWNAYQIEDSDDSFGLGWTSLNCLNDFDNDSSFEYQCNPTAPYGVYVDDSFDNGIQGIQDYLVGCAWSESFGWMCFNNGGQCDASVRECDVSGTYCTSDVECPSGETCVLSSEGQACNSLRTEGVHIEAYPINSGLDAYFYYASSPTWNGTNWVNLDSTRFAVIPSLYDSALPKASQVGFPFGDPDGDPSNGVTRFVDPVGLTGNLFGCFGCGQKCSNDKSVMCSTDADCGGDECGFYCDACLNVSTEPEDPVENPNPNLLCWDCGGKEIGTDACDFDTPGGSCSVNKDRYQCPANSCSACTNYTGLIVHEIEPGTGSPDSYTLGPLEMCGWGFNAYTDAGVRKGLGWISINSEAATGDNAYIDVTEGSILSGGDIFSPGGPPLGTYNAAFILEASGDITNWFSENAYLYENVSGLPEFLEDATNEGTYSNVLGSLDLKGTITDVSRGRPFEASKDGINRLDGTNKFGQNIIFNSQDTGTTMVGNDDVYHWDCWKDTGSEISQMDIPWIGAPDTLTRGTGGQSGAVTSVVDCDVNIPANLYYDDTGTTELQQLPSAVTIVNGDLYIDPTVTEIRGTYILLGNGDDCPPLGDPPNGCGRFITGSSDSQLRIYGSVIARQFDFQRGINRICTGGTSGSNTGAACTNDSGCTGGGQCVAGLPSEEFIPEGRLQANPPTPFRDFSQNVPRFSSF